MKNSQKSYAKKKKMHSREVADALKYIYLTITADQLIPYIRSKLKNSPSLQQNFDKHLPEGLYLLQFRECDDKNCCTKMIHCLLMIFNRKVQTTENNCPLLSVKVSQKKKDNSNFKFISSHVVAVLESLLCYVLSMNSIITVDGQKELNDIIFLCGTILYSKKLVHG